MDLCKCESGAYRFNQRDAPIQTMVPNGNTQFQVIWITITFNSGYFAAKKFNWEQVSNITEYEKCILVSQK